MYDANFVRIDENINNCKCLDMNFVWKSIFKGNLRDFMPRHIRYPLMRTKMRLVICTENSARNDGESCYVLLLCDNGLV
jgi:hypothetical protein